MSDESTNESKMSIIKIQAFVEEIVTKGRSLYNNDPKCYTKGRGINDNNFIQNHCTKGAIEEMISEKIETDGMVVRDILSGISYGMLHYYTIPIQRNMLHIYPKKDEDIISLQKALKGGMSRNEVIKLAEHVLYYCCRIFYYDLVEKKRIEKENRKIEESRSRNTGSNANYTGVAARVTSPSAVYQHTEYCLCPVCVSNRQNQNIRPLTGAFQRYPYGGYGGTY